MTDDPACPPLVLSGPPTGTAPLELGGRVTLYVCGITPYDAAHVGHAFTYSAFDTLTRFLRSRGHEVIYCQNVTDVDDDVLARAARTGEDYLELGRRETAAYLHDMDALNIARPTHFPRATQEIPSMVELAAQRGGDPDDTRKRHPLDFVVWQRSEPGEPAWDSPWGAGRPGWHLECSAMSRRYLGTTLDLHGGGADLVYPHHESERAQSEAANGVPFVRRWLHTGMVRYQGEKMSKSLGNLVFARELVRDHEPAAIRLALLGHHYRSAWEFDAEELKLAGERLESWRRAAFDAGFRAGAGRQGAGRPLPEPVDAALARDLDTVAAAAAVDELASARDGAAVAAAAAVLGVIL